MITQERTGWRDKALSERHREWGVNCPAVDLDFVMLEYDLGRPCAIIEYKNFRARTVSRAHPSIRALSCLATNSKIGFFIVRYYSPSDCSSWKFDITPGNEFGERACEEYFSSPFGTEGYIIEAEFVSFLYGLRGRGHFLPPEVCNNLMMSKIT